MALDERALVLDGPGGGGGGLVVDGDGDPRLEPLDDLPRLAAIDGEVPADRDEEEIDPFQRLILRLRREMSHVAEVRHPEPAQIDLGPAPRAGAAVGVANQSVLNCHQVEGADPFMALTLRATLICDDIRKEANGKLMLLGVYTPNILVPEIPVTLPGLSFFQIWDADEAGTYKFRAQLRHRDSQNVIAIVSGTVTAPRAGIGTLTLRVAPLPLKAVGVHEFLVMLDDKEEPAGIHVFEVRQLSEEGSGTS